MQTIAFTLKLLPGNAAEYKRRHDALWPDLKQLLQQTGIADYSIFLNEQTNELFGVLKVKDATQLQHLPNHQVMQRWWQYMADIMETNPDNSPLQQALEQVFYLP